jgi:anaerobic ribonucleoside-triphosphate reductase
MYIEASGIFSVYREEKEKPGLPMYPQIDETIYQSYESVSRHEKACSSCGAVQGETVANCPNCGKNDWVKAIV